jgi:transposase, IS30 family
MEQLNYILNNQNIQLKRLSFSHLTRKDRMIVEQLNNLKYDKKYKGPKITVSYIASKVGCNKSTISRELKKGQYRKSWDGFSAPSNRYAYDVGELVASERKVRSHYSHKVEKENVDVLNIIKIARREGVSIENAIYLYEENCNRKCPICLKTLYNYIHKKYIRYSGVKFNFKIKKHKPKKIQKFIQKGDNIRERPQEATERSEFGHIEADLIVGIKGGSKECIFTMVERMTRLALAFKIPNKTPESVVAILDEIEKIIGYKNFVEMFKTITFDNGTEFRDIEGMESSCLQNHAKRLKTYFADAYCSWQRGTNENGNKQIRRFFPKGTNFEKVSDKELMLVVNKINYTKHKTQKNNSIINQLKKMNSSILESIHLLGIKNPFSNIRRYLKLDN